MFARRNQSEKVGLKQWFQAKLKLEVYTVLWDKYGLF